MNIGMTILATDPYFSEAPLVLFPVAFIAWTCKVGTLKSEGTFIVLFHGKCKKLKSIYIVALGTIRGNTVFYKLLFMIISMTTDTFIEFQGIGKFPFMTCFTINYKMFSLQLVICFIMIKLTSPLDNLK